jgi:hypothetical protein
MRGATLTELAAQAGMMRRDWSPRLRSSTRAAAGQDTAFGKGSRAYNRFQGDALHVRTPASARSSMDRSTPSRW